MKTKGLRVVALLVSFGVASLALAQSSPVTHNTWTSGTAPMPVAARYPATGVIDGLIYVVGGETGSESGGTAAPIANNQIYDPATSTWTSGAPLPVATWGAASAVVSGTLYVIGGSLEDGSDTNAVWAYNPKKNTWTSKATMPTTRNNFGAVVEKNIIYAIGGTDTNVDRLSTVESYDPATNTWTEEAPLLNGKSEPSIGLVGTTIIAADGYTANGGDDGDNESYDVATNTWTALNPDPTGRNTACGAGIGSKMYVAGGYPAGGPGTPAYSLTESYTPSTNVWKTLASMPQAAMSSGAAVHKGQLYCFGGTALFQENAIGNVQIYQP